MESVHPEEDCLFCKIADKKLPVGIVYEDAFAIAIEDLHPQAPVHILIIPKKHISGPLDLEGEDEAYVGHLFSLSPKLAREKGIEESGFRTVVNSGKWGGQTVPHLHIHLLGGRPFYWPPG